MIFSETLLTRLKMATSVVALTGAGVSAASGVPTFRGDNGLWKKFRPEELANFSAFVKNPELVWEWYDWRRHLIQAVKPNSAHKTLADFEKIYKQFYLITQNVDNLHHLAGSKNIIELHGNIMRNKCSKCEKPYTQEFNLNSGIPICPYCSGLIRPDVVWFGELLPQKAISHAHELAINSEVFFSIGTSAIVEPAASLPYLAKEHGAYIVEINKEKTPLTASTDIFLEGAADEILPELIVEIKKNRN
jgi:NAD-dependent deacetylase